MEKPVKTATLTELATEISLFALGMRDRARSAQFSSVHQGAMKLLDEFETGAKAAKIDPVEIADVKYALAAFVDEVVLNAEWPGKDQWAEDPLQLHYFGTYLAGEGFFEKLEAIRSQVKTRSDALGVYYQCLLLGFRGKYGIAGQERLDALKKVIQGELERENAPDLNELCPHWQATDKPLPHSDRLPRGFIYTCLAIVVACVLLYAVFFISLRIRGTSGQQPRTLAYLAGQERPAGAPR